MTTDTLLAVRSELLDCIQANLAVLADRAHGPGCHLALGATLRFHPSPGDGGLPTVEPRVIDQLDDAAAGLGLTSRERHRDVGVGVLRELASRHPVLYAVADAYHLSWLPYYHRQHMAHSFLIEDADGGAGIVDAYQNVTQWGPTQPGRWYVPWAELPSAELVAVLETADVAPACSTARLSLDDAAVYVAAYANHPDRSAALSRLSLETWLLARSRKLHAAFRSDRGLPAAPELEGHLQRWDRVATQAFLARRRVERGMAEPPGLPSQLGDALAADRRVFGS